MAWKAECNRRKWYCIFGWDAVSWFSEYSYNEWRRSLTPAQIRKLEEHEKRQKEKKTWKMLWLQLQRYMQLQYESQISGKERSKI